MKITRFQFLTGFLALVVTLAVIYAGQALWQKHFVSQPLDKALKAISEVQKAELEEGGKLNEPLVVHVTLDNVNNLQDTYKAINDKIQEAYGNKAYKLEIKDSRSPELEQLFNDINYYVQEAIVDGNFPLLAEKSGEMAKKLGIECKIFVDSENIYVQLSGKSASLYDVVPRSAPVAGGNVQ